MLNRSLFSKWIRRAMADEDLCLYRSKSPLEAVRIEYPIN